MDYFFSLTTVRHAVREIVWAFLNFIVYKFCLLKKKMNLKDDVFIFLSDN